jgi:hypothetical protein
VPEDGSYSSGYKARKGDSRSRVDAPEQEAFDLSPPRETQAVTAAETTEELWVSDNPLSLGISPAEESKNGQGAVLGDLVMPLFGSCAEIVSGADVTVTFASKGSLELVAASNARIRSLDGYQIEVAEGPLVEVAANHEVVWNCSLTESLSRWPRYSALSVGAGYEMVHLFPLDRAGVLTVTDRSTRRLKDDAVRELLAVAELAAAGMTYGARLNAARELSRQLQSALDSRVIIEQAKGIVSAWLGVAPEEAFKLIREQARSNRIRLADLASAVVRGDVDERHFRTSPRGPRHFKQAL